MGLSFSPDATIAPRGVAIFAMVCPEDRIERRYVFGYIAGIDDLAYVGPQAQGSSTSRGLFLFALHPSAELAPILVVAPDGSEAGMAPEAFDLAQQDGVRQPSGCYVSG